MYNNYNENENNNIGQYNDEDELMIINNQSLENVNIDRFVLSDPPEPKNINKNTTTGIISLLSYGYVHYDKESINNLEQLSLEITLLPDIVKRSTKCISISNNNEVKWDKEFTFPIATSLLQMKSTYIKFTVFAETIKSNKNQINKRVIGQGYLDITTLLQINNDCPLVINIYERYRNQGTFTNNNISFGDICGVLSIGFRFNNSNTFDTIGKICESGWNNLLSDVSNLKLLPNQLNSGQSSIHVSFSPITMKCEFINSILAKGDGIALFCRISVGITTQSVINHLIVQDNKLVWSNSDIILTYDKCMYTSPQISFCLICGSQLNGSTHQFTSSNITLLAEGTAVFSYEACSTGIPINTSLPLRSPTSMSPNDIGNRIALLIFSVNSTNINSKSDLTILSNSNNNIEKSSGILSNKTSILQELTLRIKILDGLILDKSSQYHEYEPFFECSLIPPTGVPNSTVWQGKSGFLKKSSNEWTIFCDLKIPISIRSSQYAWTLLLICRDNSRFNAPVLGWTKLPIPLSLFDESNSPCDEWIKLSTVTNKANQISVDVGKVRLHLSILTNETIRQLESNRWNQKGVGAMLFWFDGVLDKRPEDNAMMKISSGKVNTINQLISNSDDHIINDYSNNTINEVDIIKSLNESYVVVPLYGCLNTLQFDLLTESSDGSEYHGFVSTIECLFDINRYNNQLNKIDRCKHIIPLTQNNNNNRRRIPKLYACMAYVPYVKGRLVVTVQSIEFTFAKSKYKNIDIRAMMSETSYGFTRVAIQTNNKYASSIISNTSKIKDKKIGLIIKDRQEIQILETSKSAPGYLNSSNIINNTYGKKTTITLPIDTNELLYTHLDANFKMLRLYFNCYDPSVLDNENMHTNIDNYFIGSGVIETAPLYYQSMKLAASSSLYDSNYPGKSPSIPTVVNIYNQITNELIAKLTIDLQFFLEDIPSNVITLIEDSRGKVGNDSTYIARNELGLKQAFQLADTDHSGSINLDELLVILKNSDLKEIKKKSIKGDNTLGMEDCISLLLGLINKSLSSTTITNNQSAMAISSINSGSFDDKSLTVLVKDIFSRLDIDNDGFVSWWEWKNVLLSSLLGKRSPESITDRKYILDPMDIIVIHVNAVYDALQSYTVKYKDFRLTDLSTYPYVLIDSYKTSIQQQPVINSSTRLPISNSPSKQSITINHAQPTIINGPDTKSNDSKDIRNILLIKREQNNQIYQQFNNLVNNNRNQLVNIKYLTKKKLNSYELIKKYMRIYIDKYKQNKHNEKLRKQLENDEKLKMYLISLLTILLIKYKNRKIEKFKLSKIKFLQSYIKRSIYRCKFKLLRKKCIYIQRFYRSYRLFKFLNIKIQNKYVNRLLARYNCYQKLIKYITNWIIKYKYRKNCDLKLKIKLENEWNKERNDSAIILQKSYGVYKTKQKNQKILDQIKLSDDYTQKIKQYRDDYVKNMASIKLQSMFRKKKSTMISTQLKREEIRKIYKSAFDNKEACFKPDSIVSSTGLWIIPKDGLLISDDTTVNDTIDDDENNDDIDDVENLYSSSKSINKSNEPIISSNNTRKLSSRVENISEVIYDYTNFGIVDIYNQQESTMIVKFFDESEESSVKKYEFAFDDESLEWFKYDPNKKVDESKEIHRPPFDDVLNGYHINYSNDGNEVHSRLANIIKSNITDNQMQLTIQFIDNLKSSTVPYDYPYITWFKGVLPIPTNIELPRPSIEDTVGYRIKISDSTAENVDDNDNTLIAIVEGYDLNKKILHVQFVEDNTTEDIPYKSPFIKWIEAPGINSNKTN